MRPFAITNKKILDEQQELLDKYMKEAPDDMELVDYFEANCSEYFKKFYEKRKKEIEAEGDLC